MDRSEAKAIVARHIPGLMDDLGIGYWRVEVFYDRLGSVDIDGRSFQFTGSCSVKAAYERAAITINHEDIRDAAELLDVLRHELLHVVVAPMDFYRRAMVAALGDDAAGRAEDTAWHQALEMTVRNLERFWHGMNKRADETMAKFKPGEKAIKKVKGGEKVVSPTGHQFSKKPQTKAKAEAQLRAIEVNKRAKGK